MIPHLIIYDYDYDYEATPEIFPFFPPRDRNASC
jgi:hypothetical protein